MVLVFQNVNLNSLEDIQKLSVKSLRDVLRSYKENTGGIKADLVLKVYAILMSHVLDGGPSSTQVQGQTGKDTATFNIAFSSDGDILRAACSCPAGLGISNGKGQCNHTGGVLFAMEALKDAPEATGYGGSSTEPNEAGSDLQPTAFNDSYDIATDKFKDMIDIHVSNLKISKDEANDIEIKTRGQNGNILWKEKRKQLLTASNFGKAAKTKVEPSKKLESMLYTEFVTESVLYGRENEANAAKLYKSKLEDEGHVLTVEEPGLMISHQKPQNIHETSKGKGFFIQEIEQSRFKLKQNHDYYMQVQGQLFVSELPFIDFVVFFGNDKPLYIERILFNSKQWWGNIFPKLEHFYKRALLPEILTRRVHAKRCFIGKGGGSHIGILKPYKHDM
ncbi:uncharacterized protein LOC125568048 [Nematostella vectensis]|uniref:uncharacterized protein LOC125568048 n=1 Tax=Nematostella vectensis TaxID=45351 RepID=UPI0020779205|nr:uncharacterized protein LOC125568048 [Nematostella vectensis]